MVDLDPQGNATMGSGVDKRKLELTVYDVLLGNPSISESGALSDKCGYWVLGANRELAGRRGRTGGRGAARQTPEDRPRPMADYDFVSSTARPA